MTGTEELQEFTTGIADAIREKTGTTEEINPQDFAAAIYNISGGSSDANVQAVDIGETVDGVEIEYATVEYVDNLIGDINSVLEGIINGQ